MADVLLLHHAQGLTEGVQAFAEALRAAGHRVTAPDLYDGRTFDSVDAGVAHARELGFDAVTARGVAAAEGLPQELVYAGFSLGVLPAQTLAQTRPGARAGVFLHAAMPPEAFGGPWPSGVPMQLHVMEGDELGDVDDARALAQALPEAELFLYPGEDHLFTDASLPVHDPVATALVLERVLALLDRVG